MNEGWTCPVCKRGVAPTEKYCDHGQAAVCVPSVFDIPRYPSTAPYPLTTTWGEWQLGGCATDRFVLSDDIQVSPTGQA